MVSKPELPIVHGHCSIKVVEHGPELEASPKSKPFLRMTLPDGTEFCITTNLGEMIGGAAAGTRKRWEDQQGRRDEQAH